MRRRDLLAAAAVPLAAARRRPRIEIRGERFFLDGRPTYEGRRFRDMKIEGLLMNSRMVQGIFDDANPDTLPRWRYPDTGRWDPERNTREFIAAMPPWRRHGLLSFTIGLQGGSPEGYSKDQPWRNSAFREDGSMKPEYLARLERILDRAEDLGMAPIVGYFYFGQDEHFRDEEAIRKAAENATRWLLAKGYENVMVEIANECDNRKYEHSILKPPRIAELIRLAKSIRSNERRLAVSASFNGGSIPAESVVREADFLLLHGNGVKEPERIARMVEETRRVPGYRPMPILFNEDDHFDFDRPVNNMLKAIGAYASWGYFDPGHNDYQDGYQSVPVRWTINTMRKKAFFSLLRQVTAG